MANIVHKQLSYDVVGCAQRVHSALGPGFPEVIYQKAFCHELVKSKIPFESERSSEVFYDGVLCGQFRMDVVVDSKIVVEIKALAGLTDNHIAQALSYLKATDLRLAILMNFGVKQLETRRIVH